MIRRAAWKTLDSGVGTQVEFFPSPDRRFIAARFSTQNDVRRTIIVNSDGVIVGEFDME